MFSATPQSKTAKCGEPDKQPLLPGFAAFSAETGLDVLPQGAGDLQTKELKFVLSLLRHGQQRQAAIDAGYSDKSADQTASTLLRKPHVAGFYRRALERFGADTKSAIRRLEERARVFHAKAIEAAQALGELDVMIVVAAKTGKNATTEFEARRKVLATAEKHYSQLAAESDKTLLSAAGKLGLNLNLSGTVEHQHTVRKEEGLAFAFMREVAISPDGQARREVTCGSN